MAKTRRKRCPLCGFLETIKTGKKQGKQRYFCKNCESYFTSVRKDVSAQNKFIWFERWILGKQSIRQLSQQSNYSEKTLRNIGIPNFTRTKGWDKKNLTFINYGSNGIPNFIRTKGWEI